MNSFYGSAHHNMMNKFLRKTNLYKFFRGCFIGGKFKKDLARIQSFYLSDIFSMGIAATGSNYNMLESINERP